MNKEIHMEVIGVDLNRAGVKVDSVVSYFEAMGDDSEELQSLHLNAINSIRALLVYAKTKLEIGCGG